MNHSPSLSFTWIPESVGNVLHANKIYDKRDLAKALAPLVERTTVYRAFPNDDWSGSVTTTTVVSAIAITFGVSITRLIHEPAARERAARRAASPRRAS